MSSEGFRSLADQLRGWPDERLSLLLSARPDLATPAPHDSGQLASRAVTRSSIVRALDGLDRLELSVLDALVVLGEIGPQRLAAVVHARPEEVSAAVQRAQDLALAWVSPGGLRAVTGLAEVLTGGPAAGVSGLRPASGPDADGADVAARLDGLTAPARAMLEHVLAQGGEAEPGGVRRTVTPQDASGPAEELVAHRLLVPRGTGLLVVPGEVGLALRGDRTTADPVDDVPKLSTTDRDPGRVDQTAAGAAFDAVRRIELLLDRWGAQPPATLRSGGLGVRELRATATDLQVDESAAALLVETAVGAGLVAAGADSDGDLVWLPTDRADDWVLRPPAERWVDLVRTWLASRRMPALVGQRDPAGKAWNALVPELSGTLVAETRAMTLAALTTLPPGGCLATGTGIASVAARLAWQRPRRPRARAGQVTWAVAEASVLGVTGLEGLASYARLLLDGDAEAATAALAALLPEPIDHVLLQADLTAVAPGPLEQQLARRLQLVADVESRGGATVYRFTPGSVRRALDLGWSAIEVHEFLGSVSRTPVPQPLTYLVDDTARTFGTVRVGHAEAYLRADDETALAELLGHPRAGALGLRRLAPTVLISSVPVEVLLPRLRELGAAPVVEAPDGSVHVARPDQQRARTPREHRDGRRTSVSAARRTASVAAVVTAVRAGDRAAASRPASRPDLSPSDALAQLREAADGDEAVVITYVDNHGTRSERLVDPITVRDGTLTARDQRSGDVRAFAVHRITAVREASPRRS